MDASTFELSVGMPREARFGEVVRRLAVQAATYAGCAAGTVDAFAGEVEQAFGVCLTGSAGTDVPLTFRRASGPLEVVVEGRVLTLPV